MNETVKSWLHAIGISGDENHWVYWTITLVVIGAIVFLADVLCRRLLVPLVKQLIKRTRSSWDDVLFNDTLLKDITRLVPPILIFVLFPMAFTSGHPMVELLLKVNAIYFIVVVAKLLCTFLSSLYDLSNRQDNLKNHPLKGVYQMLKIVVICVALIVIVSVLIDKNPGYILTALA